MDETRELVLLRALVKHINHLKVTIPDWDGLQFDFDDDRLGYLLESDEYIEAKRHLDKVHLVDFPEVDSPRTVPGV
jgi:hypothetical protein